MSFSILTLNELLIRTIVFAKKFTKTRHHSARSGTEYFIRKSYDN